ncbi:MAG TPA: c-type cytochrome [Burkholderiales bacterium]|nr:c-type cytochrome [Burkholderiales bacterium]
MKKLLALAAMLALAPINVSAQDAEAGRQKAEVCAACHGIDGNSTMVQNPILAAQTARYIYMQLRDFKRGRREDPMMSPMAANLTKQDMLDLAAYYSKQKFKGQNSRGDPALMTRGKAVADAALCTICHLGGFSGQNEIPRTAGQHYEYTIKQLKDFKERRRTNDAGNMTAVVRTISDEDLEAVAAYLSTLR